MLEQTRLSSLAAKLPSTSRLSLLAQLIATLALLSAFSVSARATEMAVEGTDDNPLSGECTLRRAIVNANHNSPVYPQCQVGSLGNDDIFFDVPGVIRFLTSGANEDDGATGDLDITESLTINGHPDGTTIDALDLDRIFDINPGNLAGVVVILRNIHITNGSVLGHAGAIRLRGATLILENCTISDSFADQGDGGAIVITDGGGLQMMNCTVSGNSASFHGGAMVVESGAATVTNSTIADNASLSSFTGGVRNTGTVFFRNSIVARNTNQSTGNVVPNLDGVFTSLGYNVIGALGSQAGNPVFEAQPTDQLNVTNSQLGLGPLQNNGGTTPTHSLGSGSVAVDKGESSGSTTDQRGQPRPVDHASVPNASGGDGSDVGAFEAQVLSQNSPPNALDDSFTVAEDSGTSVLPVLANDTDPDSDTLTIVAVTQGAHGSVGNNGTSVSYTPNPNFFGSDSFTYTVDDGNSHQVTATVNMTVTAVQDAPSATNDTATVAEDSGANTINVLANDVDVDGDSLSVSAVTQGAHGSVTNNGSSVSYTPAANFSGTDSFTYTAHDGHGGTATATVNVTVTPVNDAPVAVGDAYTANAAGSLSVAAPGVLGNDTDVDGDSLTAQLVTGPSHASSFALNSNGSFNYTKAAGFSGTDSFTYRASDGAAFSNTVTVNITVPADQGGDKIPPKVALFVVPLGKHHGDQLFLIKWFVTDNRPGVTATGKIDIGCKTVTISNNQVVRFDRDRDDCKARFDGGVLRIEARHAVVEVKATDAAGNVTVRSKTLH